MNCKRTVLILLSLILIISIGSCAFGDNKNNESSESSANVTAEQILTKVLEKSKEENLDSTAYFNDELFKKNCENLYNIEYSQMKDGGIAYAGSGGYADEISIIKVNDMSDSLVLSKLDKRVERRIQDFTGYKPAELNKIQNSICFTSGGYAVLIISDNAEELEKQVKFIIEQN